MRRGLVSHWYRPAISLRIKSMPRREKESNVMGATKKSDTSSAWSVKNVALGLVSKTIKSYSRFAVSMKELKLRSACFCRDGGARINEKVSNDPGIMSMRV